MRISSGSIIEHNGASASSSYLYTPAISVTKPFRGEGEEVKLLLFITVFSIGSETKELEIERKEKVMVRKSLSLPSSFLLFSLFYPNSVEE